MTTTILGQIHKEYGLEIMDCVIKELLLIPGFERLAMVKHAYEFLAKECTDETAALYSSESNKAEYAELKIKLEALLLEKKEQLINLLEIENISALLNEK